MARKMSVLVGTSSATHIFSSLSVNEMTTPNNPKQPLAALSSVGSFTTTMIDTLALKEWDKKRNHESIPCMLP